MFPRTLLVAGLLVAATTQHALATMLIVVYTPDGYWIGADSARHNNGKRVETVCKVHETKFGLLLKGGATQGIAYDGEIYSTDKEVEDVLAASTSLDEFKANLKSRLQQDIQAELAYDFHNATVTPQTLRTTLMGTPIPDDAILSLWRTVSIFPPETAQRPGEWLIVKHRNDHYSDQASGRWVQSHPKEALLQMLQKGHGEQTEEIGPPYVIVHVIQSTGGNRKIEWVERGPCPSWTEDILPDDSSQQSPNP